VVIKWTGQVESPFPGSLTSTFLYRQVEVMSDEEERFVDEAARRGAAAASMRLRDRMVGPLLPLNATSRGEAP